VSRIVNEECKA